MRAARLARGGTLPRMRRLRTHDPPGYVLSLAAVVALIGGVLMSYEGSRFGKHADPWYHFWFDFGVGFMGLAALLVIASVVLFVREMRRSPSAEQELTGHMERAHAGPRDRGRGRSQTLVSSRNQTPLPVATPRSAPRRRRWR
jgi:hypothetical protein